MKFPHLCLAVSLGSVACGGGDDPVTGSSLGSVGVAPGLDAGVSVGPSTGVPGGPTTGNPVTGPTTTNPTPVEQNGGVCEVQTIDSGRVTPDMLIVLDRSGSMRNNGVNRWDPSVGALKSITSSLGGAINFGLMTYPGASMAPAPMPTQDCLSLTDIVAQIACFATEAAGGIATLDTCVPGSLDVPVAPNNGAAIGAALDRMQPQGATPTAASLKAAHTALGSVVAAVDDVARPKFVLLVTDGAPNCSTANSTGGGRGGFDNTAVEQSVAEIASMAQDGIKTFVIGYNTKSDRQLSTALDRMAQAGATGDQQHHAIEDGDALLAEFQKIAGAAASCEFTLNKQPTNPSYVEVKLDGKQVAYNDPNGWLLSSDRKRITLQGSACSTIASKEQHLLSVRVLCSPVVLQ